MDYFDFGKALSYLKQGHAVSRKGWNGNNMHLFMNRGSIDISDLSPSKESPNQDQIEGVPGDLFEMGPDGTYTMLPNINMVNANNRIVTGWLASQTDLLAEDWFVYIV